MEAGEKKVCWEMSSVEWFNFLHACNPEVVCRRRLVPLSRCIPARMVMMVRFSKVLAPCGGLICRQHSIILKEVPYPAEEVMTVLDVNHEQHFDPYYVYYSSVRSLSESCPSSDNTQIMPVIRRGPAFSGMLLENLSLPLLEC